MSIYLPLLTGLILLPRGGNWQRCRRVANLTCGLIPDDRIHWSFSLTLIQLAIKVVVFPLQPAAGYDLGRPATVLTARDRANCERCKRAQRKGGKGWAKAAAEVLAVAPVVRGEEAPSALTLHRRLHLRRVHLPGLVPLRNQPGWGISDPSRRSTVI